jgi:hypothetical protein
MILLGQWGVLILFWKVSEVQACLEIEGRPGLRFGPPHRPEPPEPPQR